MTKSNELSPFRRVNILVLCGCINGLSLGTGYICLIMNGKHIEWAEGFLCYSYYWYYYINNRGMSNAYEWRNVGYQIN